MAMFSRVALLCSIRGKNTQFNGGTVSVSVSGYKNLQPLGFVEFHLSNILTVSLDTSSAVVLE